MGIIVGILRKSCVLVGGADGCVGQVGYLSQKYGIRWRIQGHEDKEGKHNQ